MHTVVYYSCHGYPVIQIHQRFTVLEYDMMGLPHTANHAFLFCARLSASIKIIHVRLVVLIVLLTEQIDVENSIRDEKLLPLIHYDILSAVAHAKRLVLWSSPISQKKCL